MKPTELLALISRLETSQVMASPTLAYVPIKEMKTICAELRQRIEREQSGGDFYRIINGEKYHFFPEPAVTREQLIEVIRKAWRRGFAQPEAIADAILPLLSRPTPAPMTIEDLAHGDVWCPEMGDRRKATTPAADGSDGTLGDILLAARPELKVTATAVTREQIEDILLSKLCAYYYVGGSGDDSDITWQVPVQGIDEATDALLPLLSGAVAVDREKLANWFADEEGPFDLIVSTGKSPYAVGLECADALIASGLLSAKEQSK
jgi:hypothetical protein